jgi:hypothetical protein
MGGVCGENKRVKRELVKVEKNEKKIGRETLGVGPPSAVDHYHYELLRYPLTPCRGSEVELKPLIPQIVFLF